MLRKDVNNANNILKHESRNHKGSCTILLLLLYNSVIIIVQFRAHWQLFVLHPRENTVVWFCSLRKKPDINIKGAINSAMKTITSSFEGMSNQGAPRWVEPKWFSDGSSLDVEAITTVRQKWATYFLSFRKSSC
ncbi:hypothetical protein GmHk_17G049039 [Glycine max]|nr:hypothetical protein GmHk_17G049039 [Glycine max]